jgi:hypothetical protein
LPRGRDHEDVSAALAQNANHVLDEGAGAPGNRHGGLVAAHAPGFAAGEYDPG